MDIESPDLDPPSPTNIIQDAMHATEPDRRRRLFRRPQWPLEKLFPHAKKTDSVQPRNCHIALLVVGIFVFVGFTVTMASRHPPPTDWKHIVMAWDDKEEDKLSGGWSDNAGHTWGDGDLERISNRTLGFDRVFSIGLGERTDKRDAMTLMASLTGFDIEWFEGVRPGDIPDKAVPFGIDVAAVRDEFLGSWRGHMNAIRHIVERGISSALIMEDDMDWDVHLKSQLEGVARGTRRIFAESDAPVPHSPYGDAWDLLWLGHCGDPFPETLEENLEADEAAKAKVAAKYVIQNDRTVPPYTEVSSLVDWDQYPAQTRIVHRSAAPLCSFAYAISQRGARKMLHALSIEGLHMAFDNSLAQVCRNAVSDILRDSDGGYDARCISVNPTMMFHHKARGLTWGDSDNPTYGKGGEVRQVGFTEAVMWSTRLNLKNLLTGKPVEAQFAQESG